MGGLDWIGWIGWVSPGGVKYRAPYGANKTLPTINPLEYPIPTATAVTATRHKNRHMALHVAAAWYHRSKGVKDEGPTARSRAPEGPLYF